MSPGAGIAWSLFFLLIGYYFGLNWRDYIHYSERLTVISVAAAVLLIAGYIWLHRRRRSGRTEKASPSSLDPQG